jgi:hypothetical protein
MGLIQLIYMSTLTDAAQAELPGILATAVKNNAAKGITGMLMYSGGNIMQVMEGPKEAVHATFQSIERDARHFDIFVLIEEVITSRNFSAWSMGYRDLAPEELQQFPQAAHIFNCRPDELALRVRPSDALEVLKSFADGAMSIR